MLNPTGRLSVYSPKPNIRWSQVPIWVRVVWLIFALDVIAYYVGTTIVGGDAAKSYQQEGKYFLTGGPHSREVSRSAYYYFNGQLVSIGIAMGLSIVGGRRVSGALKKSLPR